MSDLHVWHDGCDWYVARDFEHLCELVAETHGPVSRDDWEQRPGTSRLTITIDDETTPHKTITKTCAEWAQSNGVGFLCSEEW